MSSKTVWIIYSSRKGGHAYPSNALCSYINEQGGGYRSQLINILDLSSTLSYMDKIGRLGDLRLRRVYRHGYHRLQEGSQGLKNMYRLIEGLVYKNSKVMEKLIWHYGIPDLIVSIQPEVNVVARFFKSWFASPFHTVIIDLAIHGLWVNEHVDKYYVANQPLKYDLIKFGVPESRTIVSGMPLRDGFSTVARKSVRAIRAKLGLSLVHRTVLFVGGLLGKMLDFEGAFKSIADLKIPLQVLAVFGENDTAFKRAAVLKASYKYPMHLWRTVNNMHELIWASDVVVSKPGSMTMAEVMSLGKPLIAINPLAGSAQELRFASFLEENGAGMWIRDVKELGVALRDVVTSKTKYNQISKNAQALGKYGLDANKIIFASIKRSFADKEE